MGETICLEGPGRRESLCIAGQAGSPWVSMEEEEWGLCWGLDRERVGLETWLFTVFILFKELFLGKI